MRGSESAATSSPTISLIWDSTLRVRPLKAMPPAAFASSKLDKLLPPLEYRQLLVVQEDPPELLALLLRRPTGSRGERERDRSPLPEILAINLHDGDVFAPEPVFEGPQGL